MNVCKYGKKEEKAFILIGIMFPIKGEKDLQSFPMLKHVSSDKIEFGKSWIQNRFDLTIKETQLKVGKREDIVKLDVKRLDEIMFYDMKENFELNNLDIKKVFGK